MGNYLKILTTYVNQIINCSIVYHSTQIFFLIGFTIVFSKILEIIDFIESSPEHSEECTQD